MEEETTSGAVRGECLCMGAGPQATAILKSINLGGATEHFRKSRIEFLKGIRTVLDERIEHLGRTPHKGMRVEVD